MSGMQSVVYAILVLVVSNHWTVILVWTTELGYFLILYILNSILARLWG